VLAWERDWVAELVATHGGNLSRAARAAKMAAVTSASSRAAHGVAAGDTLEAAEAD